MPDRLKKEADALALALEVNAVDISDVLVCVNAVMSARSTLIGRCVS